MVLTELNTLYPCLLRLSVVLRQADVTSTHETSVHSPLEPTRSPVFLHYGTVAIGRPDHLSHCCSAASLSLAWTVALVHIERFQFFHRATAHSSRAARQV